MFTSINIADAVVRTLCTSVGNIPSEIKLSGAAQSEYDGYFPITVTGSSTFTYTVAGTAVTPATGTISAKTCSLATKATLTSVTSSGTTATATLTNHGLVNGQAVLISLSLRWIAQARRAWRNRGQTGETAE